MSFHNPIVEAGVAGLTALFRDRAVTPSEATETYLARIERLNPMLGAVTATDAEGARAAAEASGGRWRNGEPLSNIDGVPIAVKANIAIAGLPWTSGVGAYRGRIPARDAETVERLRAAGAVILGALNMHEGALGATTDNLAYGRCYNPYRHGWTPGGSSGGSGAATAAGLCAAALGTDTMGSVRIPSAYCGVFGFKPAKGFISTAGVEPLSWTYDHVGVHARSAEDARLLAVAASGQEIGSQAVQGPIAVLDFEGQVEVDAAVADAFAAAIEAARKAGLQTTSLRLSDYDFSRLRRAGLLVGEAEGAVVHAAALAEDPEGFSPEFRALLDWGAGQPAIKLARAYRDLAKAVAEVEALLAPFAGLLTPTAPQTAFPFEQGAPANQADFTALGAFMGAPAVAFPTGLSPDGLPLSGQIIARDAATALALAEALSSPFARSTPSGFSA
ncbi:amidase [Caulobacter segnis]|uniref:Amidase n=1 Tax=Caulobacter segnis TaxID=88688 RepID=A0A2W5VJP4_9CAUL|nr:amidase [Caulobacter segnis]PZR36926.1 MAG: amidase [Caulobacter segnis]